MDINHIPAIPIPNVRYIEAGKFFIGSQKGNITSTPLGTCIAIIAYDALTKTGGMAHVMLPGKSPTSKTKDRNIYIEDCLEALQEGFEDLGLIFESLQFCLIGAANVLKKEDTTLCQSMINNITDSAEDKNLQIVAKSLGGMERRVAKLDISKGIVSFTLGDNAEQILWDFSKNKQ